MNCTLCEKPIEHYDSFFSHFEIDESHSADICPECIEKFTQWRQDVYTKLFPTTAAKRRIERTNR